MEYMLSVLILIPIKDKYFTSSTNRLYLIYTLFSGTVATSSNKFHLILLAKISEGKKNGFQEDLYWPITFPNLKMTQIK